jgi:hypothetical protein
MSCVGARNKTKQAMLEGIKSGHLERIASKDKVETQLDEDELFRAALDKPAEEDTHARAKFEVAQQALGTALHTLERVRLLLYCCHARHTALRSLSAILPVMVTRQQLV